VARCLALADELGRDGAEVRFVMRSPPAHFRQSILASGHSIAELGPAAQGSGADASEDDDAAATIAALGDFAPDVVVVDHYALGARWESRLRATARTIFALDDLGRAHDCDLLLDQNLHRDAPARYRGRVPRACKLLLGPRYALLRPEFARLRAGLRPRSGKVRNVIVSLGGSDPANLTEYVLKSLLQLRAADLSVDVVIGALHPQPRRIAELCAALPAARLHVQASNLADLLGKADLAIGGGGSGTWERCALGVPTIALCVAENQRALLSEAAGEGLLYLPDGDAPFSPALEVHLAALLACEGLRSSISRNGMATVDGAGTGRVAAAVRGRGVGIRPARADDAAWVLAWRNSPKVREMSFDQQPISPEAHERWFANALVSADRSLLIAQIGSAPVGVVRFDRAGAEAVVSIYLDPARMGRGLGAPVLLAAERWYGEEHPEVRQLKADVLESNAASRVVFERCGYVRLSTRLAKSIDA
jgi:UDP-2,4-diacetamido-2,4,6-trideoxy-beta-L-altropyranose hydrolase